MFNEHWYQYDYFILIRYLEFITLICFGAVWGCPLRRQNHEQWVQGHSSLCRCQTPCHSPAAPNSCTMGETLMNPWNHKNRMWADNRGFMGTQRFSWKQLPIKAAFDGGKHSWCCVLAGRVLWHPGGFHLSPRGSPLFSCAGDSAVSQGGVTTSLTGVAAFQVGVVAKGEKKSSLSLCA